MINQSNEQTSLEHHSLHDSRWGEYLGSAVYGGLDGVVTTFAVIAGGIGAQLSLPVLIVLGLANLFADGFSMGIGNFLSKKSEADFFQKQKLILEKIYEENSQEFKLLLQNALTIRKCPTSLLTNVVDNLIRHKSTAVDEILLRKQLSLPDVKPWQSATITFFSFILFGALPILLIIIFSQPSFYFLLAVVGVVLFLLGSLRSFITSIHWIRGGLEIMIAGLLASLIAYGVGEILSQLLLMN